jgi:hypothetical protein
MKFLIKVGTAATVSFLLCSPASGVELDKVLSTNKSLSEASAQISGNHLSQNANPNPTKDTPNELPIPVNPEQPKESVPVVSGGNVAEIAKMLPENTPLVGIISTKISAWQDLNRFQLFKMAGDAIKAFFHLVLI